MKYHPDDELNDIKIIVLKFILFASSIVFAIYSVIFLFKGGDSREYFPEFISSQMGWGRAVVISFLFSALLALSAWWCYKLFNDFRLAKHNYITIIGLAVVSLLTGSCKIGLILVLALAFFLFKTSEPEELYNVNRRVHPKPFKVQLRELGEKIHGLIFEIVEEEPEYEESEQNENVEVEKSNEEEQLPDDIEENYELEEIYGEEQTHVNFVDKVIERVKEEENPSSPRVTPIIVIPEEHHESAAEVNEEIALVDNEPIIEEKVAILSQIEEAHESSLYEENESIETEAVSEESVPQEEVDDNELLVDLSDEIVNNEVEVEQEIVNENPIVEQPSKPKTLGQIQTEYEEGKLTHDEYELEKQAYLERQMSRARKY